MQVHKKIADVPDNLQRLDAPVSKEYDAVRYVYGQFVEFQIEAMPWRIFQQKFQQFAAKYNQLFTEIRHNRPQITEQDLKAWLDQAQSPDNYKIDYSEYEAPEHSFRDVKQLVLQINQGADASEILAEDPVVEQYVSYVAQSSAYSGHPAAMKTVGWLRVDFINQDWLLVDEVQSDLVNSVTQARAILEADSFDEFVANITNEKMKRLVLERIDERQFNTGKRNFINSGYTLEKLEEIKQRLITLFQDWAEYGIASLLEIARKHYIKNIAIHTAETIAQRDGAMEADKVKIYYDHLAKSFGFKKQHLDVGELQGNFWVRTASQDLRDWYARPTMPFKSALLHYGYKSAGMISVMDLDRYDSEVVADILSLHDEIAMNPVRGSVPEYQNSYAAERVWKFTYDSLRNRLLPAIKEAIPQVSKKTRADIQALLNEAVADLTLAQRELDKSGDYSKSGKELERAFQQLHNAIELIRDDTRRVPRGRHIRRPTPHGFADYSSLDGGAKLDD